MQSLFRALLLSTLLALFVAPALSAPLDNVTVTGTRTDADVLFTQNVQSYSQVSVQFTSIGSGNSVTFEESSNGSTWVPAILQVQSAVGATPTSVHVISATANYLGQASKTHFRARVSTYSSGTVTAIATFKATNTTFANGAFGTGASSLQVQGPVAADAVNAGNPVGIACNADATPNAVSADGDAQRVQCNLSGEIYIAQSPPVPWSYAAATGGISNTTTAVTIKGAVASNRNCVTGIQLSSDALGAATEFAIRDGAGGTVLWRDKISTAGIVAGYSAVLPSPICGTANTLLEIVTLTASITGAVFFNGQGFVQP